MATATSTMVGYLHAPRLALAFTDITMFSVSGRWLQSAYGHHQFGELSTGRLSCRSGPRLYVLDAQSHELYLIDTPCSIGPAPIQGPFDSTGFPVGCKSACAANLDGNPSTCARIYRAFTLDWTLNTFS